MSYPQEIRNDLGIEEGNQIVMSRFGELVLMKKVVVPDLKKEFNELTGFGTKFARKKGIRSEEDVVSRIHKARGVS